MHVKEGTVLKLLCPDTKCGAIVPPNILKILLGEDEFRRWEALLLQRTLDAMVNVVYCPDVKLFAWNAGYEAVCSSCVFSFCTLCREPRHVGVECISPEEKLHILVVRGLYLSLLHYVLLYPNFTRKFIAIRLLTSWPQWAKLSKPCPAICERKLIENVW
jgi:hypothetical protein